MPGMLVKLRTRLYRTSSWLQAAWYRRVWGMTIGEDVRISRSAKLDRTNPRGVHIGDSTLISFDAAILTHDFVGNRHMNTFIGSNCFIGARSMILAGVRVGNNSVVGAGSVVIADVPPNSIVAGNPVIDLDYVEDSGAQTDANFVITGSGGIVWDWDVGRDRLTTTPWQLYGAAELIAERVDVETINRYEPPDGDRLAESAAAMIPVIGDTRFGDTR